MEHKLINATSYLNGKFAMPNSTVKTNYSPEDNLPICNYSEVDSKTINDAIEQSHFAQLNWRQLSATDRINYIKEFNKLLEINQDLIATNMVDCIAKTFNDSKNEVKRTIEMINELIKQYETKFCSPHEIKITNKDNELVKEGIWTYEPLGIIMAIGPFNYPVNLLLSKVIPALLTGNAVIYKSAHQTIQIGFLLATLFDQAKFPNGVINFLIANNEDLDNSVFNNKYIRLVNFTGGTKNGKEIANKLPFGIYKVFELGGLDPALITSYNDNPTKVAKEIIKGSFSYNGQRCTAIKRILLLKSNQAFNQSFINELVRMAQKLTLGRAIDNPDLTCLISNVAVKKVKALYDDAVSKGAKALLPFQNEGNLVHPIILDNVTNTMDIYRTEAFGPIVPIMYANNIEEMIQIANDTTYGLQASVFTNNQDEWEYISKQIDSGSVNWNRSSSRGPDIFPFLGVKDSGHNVQGIYHSILTTVRLKGYIENFDPKTK